jgi:hypothetical protein
MWFINSTSCTESNRDIRKQTAFLKALNGRDAFKFEDSFVGSKKGNTGCAQMVKFVKCRVVKRLKMCWQF